MLLDLVMSAIQLGYDEAACAEIRQEDVVRRISEQVPVPSMGGERTLP